MKHHTRFALAGLLSAVALTVAACGGAGGNAGGINNGGVSIKQRRRVYGAGSGSIPNPS